MTTLTKILSFLMFFSSACIHSMESNEQLILSAEKHNNEYCPLIKMPYEVLSIMVKTLKTNLFDAIKVLIQMSKTCKPLNHLKRPDVLKLLLKCNQEELDNNIFKYNRPAYVPFLKLLITMGANINATHDCKPLLILTIQHKNNLFVKELLMQKNIDVNQTDKWNSTPLHHAALQNNEKALHLLLRDYRVNSLAKNTDNMLAYDYMKYDSKLKPSLFARSFLEAAVTNQVLLLPKQYCDATINKTVINVINAHKQVHKQDSLVPEEADLPCYANNEFIKKMIIYRIECQ